MKALKVVIAVLIALSLFLSASYIFFPKQAARVFMAGSLWITWMRHNAVEVDGYTIHTLDGGHGEPLILLHGIYSRKENWLKVGRKLDAYTRVIIPDLPGFGDNAPLEPIEYALDQQAQRIIAMIDELGIEKFHLAGSSMGGGIAALIAAEHPQRILSLTFPGSPFGVRTMEPSELDTLLENGGNNPLIATDAETSRLRDTWLAPQTPYFHDMLRQAWPVGSTMEAGLKRRIWDVVTANPPDLLEIAPQITAPVLIFWCDGDRVFDVSGAPLLAGALPKAHLHVMKGCGHSPVIDRSNWLAKHYVRDLELIEAGVWPLPD